jgi:peptidoglycan-N-acetylglucosamine deacetylase
MARQVGTLTVRFNFSGGRLVPFGQPTIDRCLPHFRRVAGPPKPLGEPGMACPVLANTALANTTTPSNASLHPVQLRASAAWLAAASAGVAIAHAGPGITGIGPVRMLAFPRLSGRGDPAHVALTFDDGPDPASTPAFLQVLAERGVTATFFQLGSMITKAPGLAAEVAEAGHEIGVHGFEHRYLTVRGPRATRSDLSRATDVIASVTGRRPSLFRPPYGVLTGPALVAARELGLSPVLWGAWGREWTAGATGPSVFDTLRRGLTGGATVLLHDSGCTSPPGSWQAALAALPLLLDDCERRGLRVGPVGEHGIPGLAAGAGLPGSAGQPAKTRP